MPSTPLPLLETEMAPRIYSQTLRFSLGKDGDCLPAPVSQGESQKWLLGVFYSHTPSFRGQQNGSAEGWTNVPNLPAEEEAITETTVELGGHDGGLEMS